MVFGCLPFMIVYNAVLPSFSFNSDTYPDPGPWFLYGKIARRGIISLLLYKGNPLLSNSPVEIRLPNMIGIPHFQFVTSFSYNSLKYNTTQFDICPPGTTNKTNVDFQFL
jgi:hypothetical protein